MEQMASGSSLFSLGSPESAYLKEKTRGGEEGKGGR